MADNVQIQFLRGTTAENDAYTGREGEFTVDLEKNELRLHDGETKGGHGLQSGGDASNILVWDKSVTEDLGSAEEKTSFEASIQAHTAFGDENIQYSVSAGSLPEGLSIDDSDINEVVISGTLTNYTDTQTFEFQVEAYDGFNTVKKDFTLKVNAENEAPVWDTAKDLGVMVGDVSIQLEATDPEGQSLTYSIKSGALPSGVSLSESGLLSGSVTPDGQTYTVTIAVSDGVNSVNRKFTALTGQDKTDAPGPKAWSHSDPDNDPDIGFFGEVPAADFIKGDALATAIGLSAGTAKDSNSPWLKYSTDGVTKLVALRNFRYGLSWKQINSAGAVDGTADVTIDGVEYWVELMEGGNDDPTHDSAGYDVQAGVGSEWNRLFYRLSNGQYAYDNTSNSRDSERPFTEWGLYSDDQMNMNYKDDDGSYSWCKEVHGSSSSRRVGRGSSGVSRLYRYTSSSTHSARGWRPVLIPKNQ